MDEVLEKGYRFTPNASDGNRVPERKIVVDIIACFVINATMDLLLYLLISSTFLHFVIVLFDRRDGKCMRDNLLLCPAILWVCTLVTVFRFGDR